MTKTDELYADMQILTNAERNFTVNFRSTDPVYKNVNNRCTLLLKNYFPTTNNLLKLTDDLHLMYVRVYEDGEWSWKRDVAILGKRENLGKQGAIDILSEIYSGTLA